VTLGMAKLNVWIRNEDCSLNNAWMADLEIKTCTGKNLIDVLTEPDLKKLQEQLEKAYPDAKVTLGSAYGTKTIKIKDETYNETINNILVNVPPGCYVIRVHVCGGNEWSCRTMVIVSCEKVACVNLIVPEAETCAQELIGPYLNFAELEQIPFDQVKLTVDALGRLAKIPLENVARDFDERIELLKDDRKPRAVEIVKQARFGLRVIKDIQLKSKRRA